MKKIIISTFCLLFACVFALNTIVASDSAISVLSWEPPTHSILNNDCGQTGTPLTQQEIASLLYDFKWKLVNENDWNTSVISDTTIELNLVRDKTYEAIVGAKRPDQNAICFTQPLVFTTPPLSPPGTCSNMTVTFK